MAKQGIKVFSQPGGAVMGFAIIRSDIKDEAKAKLKIPRHPSAAIVTEVLLSNPPTTEEQARKVFEYLTNLLGGMYSYATMKINLWGDGRISKR